MAGDWILQSGDTWQSYTLTDHTLFDEVVCGSSSYLPLTTWTTSAEGSTRYRYPEDNERIVTSVVRGHIHGNFWPVDQTSWAAIWDRNWRVLVTYRITVIPQRMDSLTVEPLPDYDLGSPTAANDTFCWERSRLHVNVATSEWTGTPGMRTNVDWTVPVYAKVPRWIPPGQCLALCIQVESARELGAVNTYAEVNNILAIHSTVRLRTFASYR